MLHVDNLSHEIDDRAMHTFRSFFGSSALLAALCGVALSAEPASFNIPQIEQLTGLKGLLNEAEGVFKLTIPRSDVAISVDGWKMPSFMGPTSWAAFTKGKQAEAMVMG